jgi:hypothetical protein
MKKLLRRSIALGFGLAVAGGCLPAVGHAQTISGETALLNLTPRKVHMKTVSETMHVGDTWKDVFSPTTIDCYGGDTCVVRVTVSSDFSNINPDETVAARVLVDGLPFPISPGEILMVAGENVAFYREAARSFMWVGWDLPPGPRMVSVQFKTYPDGVGAHSLAFNRTLTIDVFKP